MQFLFLVSERFRDLAKMTEYESGDPDSVFLKGVSKYYSFVRSVYAKRVEWNGSVYNWPWGEAATPLDNIELFLAEAAVAFRGISIESAQGPVSEEDAGLQMADLFDFMVNDAPEAMEELSSEHFLLYLARLLYADFERLFPTPPREEGDEEVYLGEMLERMRDEEMSAQFKEHLNSRPMEGCFASELLRCIFGEVDIGLLSDPVSDKVAQKFSVIARRHLSSHSAKELLDSKLFTTESPDQFSMSTYTIAPNVSVGVMRLPIKFDLEKTHKSFEFFIPGSEFYAMQKTSLPLHYAVRGVDVPEDIPEERATPWDRIKYPTLVDALLRLKGSSEYVTEDYDWKFTTYDFKADTFVALHYKLGFDQIPRGLSDYCFFFGSKHLGWASGETINVMLLTDRRLRYLTKINSNLSMFVAPDPNTPLRYLLMYIEQNINMQLVSGDEEAQLAELKRSVKFYSKLMGGTPTRARDLDLSTKLTEIRELVNPGFDKSTHQIDFICVLKHPKNPTFDKYRSKDKKLDIDKIKPITQLNVPALKLHTDELLNHTLRWAVGPRLASVQGRPLLGGKHLSGLLPLFILFDVSNLSSILLNPKTGFNLSYIHSLVHHLSLGKSHEYRLKGLVLKKKNAEGADRYFPVIVGKDGVKLKSFETGKIADRSMEDFPDESIKYMYLESVELKV